ncbi:MAG: sulfotransferase family 2 domain-containing protein [Planctomycetota bacterium]
MAQRSQSVSPRARALAGEPVLFLHMPRTAGTTLRSLTQRQYEPNQVFSLYTELTSDRIERIHECPPAWLEQVSLVLGHFRFGLHERLPGQPVYFTMLRDPVDRVISDYHYILSNPDHAYHHLVKGRGLSLEDFVRSEDFHFTHNGQARGLAGLGAVRDRSQLPSDERAAIWQTAMSNLEEHFVFLGLTEEFDKSILIFQDRLGWKTPYYEVKNVNTSRPRRDPVPESVRSLIAEANAIDIELYRWAKQQFDIAVSEGGPGFQQRVEDFQETNRQLMLAFETAEQLTSDGETRAAMDLLESAIRYEPDCHYVHLAMSVAARTAGDQERALEHAAHALRLDSFDRRVILHCAELLEDSGRVDRAMGLLRFFLENQNPYDDGVVEVLRSLTGRRRQGFLSLLRESERLC